MARTRWPPGPVIPGLLPRPGRSDRQRRWVPKTGARPTARSQDNPNGVGRFGGQAGPGPDPTPASPHNVGSRAGTLTHILPADYAPGSVTTWWLQPAHRSPGSVLARSALLAGCGVSRLRHRRSDRDSRPDDPAAGRGEPPN